MVRILSKGGTASDRAANLEELAGRRNGPAPANPLPFVAPCGEGISEPLAPQKQRRAAAKRPARYLDQRPGKLTCRKRGDRRGAASRRGRRPCRRGRDG